MRGPRKSSAIGARVLVDVQGAGTAGIFWARITGIGSQIQFVPDVDTLETVAASGVAASQRPTEKIRARVLLPVPYPESTVVGESARIAYRAAARLRVDDNLRALAHDNDRDVMEVLALRRGGRPLPASPWSGT